MASTSVSSLTGVTSYDGAETVGRGVFSITKNDLATLLDSARVSAQESATGLQALISNFDRAAGAGGTMTLAQFRAYVAENGYTFGGSATPRAGTSATSSTRSNTSTLGNAASSSASGASSATGQSTAPAGTAGAASAASSTGASGPAGSASTAGTSGTTGTSSASATDATEELATLTQSELEIRAAAGDQDAIDELERRAGLYGGNALLQSFTAQSAGSRFNAYA